jgi:hypothetical protein
MHAHGLMLMTIVMIAIKLKLNIFYQFKNRPDNRLWKDTKIINDDEFEQLFEYIKGESSGFWAKVILVYDKNSPLSFPVMFKNEYAEKLIAYIHNTISDKNQYKYIHTIRRSVLCPFLIADKDAIFSNYHARGGIEIETIKLLHKFWATKFKWLYNCSGFSLGECTICINKIYQHNSIISCLYCQNMYHKDCLHAHFKYKLKTNNKFFKCPLCANVLKDDDVKYINFICAIYFYWITVFNNPLLLMSKN